MNDLNLLLCELRLKDVKIGDIYKTNDGQKWKLIYKDKGLIHLRTVD